MPPLVCGGTAGYNGTLLAVANVESCADNIEAINAVLGDCPVTTRVRPSCTLQYPRVRTGGRRVV